MSPHFESLPIVQSVLKVLGVREEGGLDKSVSLCQSGKGLRIHLSKNKVVALNWLGPSRFPREKACGDRHKHL